MYNVEPEKMILDYAFLLGPRSFLASFSPLFWFSGQQLSWHKALMISLNLPALVQTTDGLN